MNFKVICVVVGCLVVIVSAGPLIDDSPSQNSVHVNENSSVEETLLKKLNNKCSNHDVSSCMMLKLVTYFNRLLKKSQIDLGDVEITQTSTETVKLNAARNMEDVKSMSDEEQLFSVLTEKAMSFIKTRSLKWKVLDETEVVVSGKEEKDGGVSLGLSLRPTTDVNEARKKKNNNMGGGLMAAAIMKIGLIKALAFKALVLLVGKALLVSKLALVLAAVIGLKKLFSQEKHVTYEVVAHPHHESHHHESHHEHAIPSHDSYSGGDWGRNYDSGKLAYRAHVPN